MSVSDHTSGSQEPEVSVITSARQIEALLSRLMAMLEEIQSNDPELRQLWLEAHWLSSDLRRGVFSPPTRWELSILAVSRGRVGGALRAHPEVLQITREVGDAIKTHLKKPL